MKIKNTYEREIARKPLNNILFSGGLAFIIIFVTGMFGIKPTLSAVSQNIQYKKELVELKSNMETKLEQVENSQNSLAQAQEKVAVLDNKIPTEADFQKFLEQLVAVSARSNFVILQANQQEKAKGSKEYIVGTKLNGQLSNLPSLLNGLENIMPRFVTIDRVRTQNQPEENYDLVEIVMKTYTL